jgi:predicted DNA binding CopG/RHH family protein
MKRRVPKFTTDEEAEAFLESDLSHLDFSQFKSGRLRFEKASTKPGSPSETYRFQSGDSPTSRAI